jgi:N6-L-threonylcarbamoyladenine synthase
VEGLGRGVGVSASRPSAAPAGGPAPAALLLCLETSCDDTSAALVRGGEVLSSVVSSQHEFHAAFGGVVPEVASRRHTELLDSVVRDALAEAGAGWDDVEGVAVTVGPGLIGALLVGVAAAKACAYALRLPLTPVNHLEGHLAAARADGAEAPYLCLTASGGHTLLAAVEEGVRYRLLGRTLDDAAGEAFDKGARLLGLAYPGGAELDRLAREGDPAAVRFPRSLPRGLDFSFSGLKTAVLYYLREHGEAGTPALRAGVAASYQEAIVDQLVSKTMRCAADEGLPRVALGGGVAANSRLRERLREACGLAGLELFLPPPSLCTDNAAMIGLAARFLPAIPWPDYLVLDAFAADRQARGRRR